VHALDKRKKKQTIPLHFASSVSLPEITKIRLRAFAAKRQSCLFVCLFVAEKIGFFSASFT